MSISAPEGEAHADRPVGLEARKTIHLKYVNGFIQRYLSGQHILDIGYRGYIQDVVPIVPQAIGVDMDYPGYDGRTLPFAAESQDAVYSSHCLEHIEDYRNAIKDWFRVLKPNGYIVIVVPHQYLYEKRTGLPSRWNEDHKRFYTPASLMAEIEESLPPNCYRVRHLADNDLGYDYAVGPEQHAGGCYELELVIQKLRAPNWTMESPPIRPAPAAPRSPTRRERLATRRERLANVLKVMGRVIPGPIKDVLRPIVRRLV